jgi:hypothetical protein
MIRVRQLRKCEICRSPIYLDIYCEKCWKIVFAITMDIERYKLVKEFLDAQT